MYLESFSVKNFNHPCTIDINLSDSETVEKCNIFLGEMAGAYKGCSETAKNSLSHKLFLELRDRGLFSIDYYWVSCCSSDGDENVDRYENWPSDVRLFVRQLIDQMYQQV